MLDPIILLVGGKQFGGWTEASVTASASEAVRTFEVTTSERRPDWPIKPQDEVSVITGGDVLVKGFVDDYSASLSESSHTATISGRGKTCDLVDCTAVHQTGRFKNVTIEDVAKELAKTYGVQIKNKAKNLKKKEKFQLQMGETVFSALERFARSHDLMLVGGADGSLEIHDQPEEGMFGEIVEGNFLQIDTTISTKDRHKEYVVKAQRAFSDIAKDLKIEKKSVDQAVTRKRIRTILGEGDQTEKETEDRANNEKTTQQGRSIKATVTVTGFRNSKGQLWAPLKKVFLYAPTVHLEQTMAIESVEFSKGAEAKTQTKLDLVDPKALKDKKGGDSRSKSDKAYKAG
jgi:prophage tail gpP-like protein